MIFGFTPVVEASITTLMKSVDKVIINPIILFLFALALAYFLYGVAQYLLSPNNEEINKKSKTQMLTGIAGLFIMVAVFGILKIILNTIGENRIKIYNNGNYEIAQKGGHSSTDTTVDKIKLRQMDLTLKMIDLRSAKNIDLTNIKTEKISNYKISPFRVKYIDNEFCWHKDVLATGNVEYESLTGVKAQAKEDLYSASGIKGTPLSFGLLTAYSPSNTTYYSWMDARYPLGKRTSQPCVLKVDTKKTASLPLSNYVSNHPFSVPTDMSNGPSIFTTSYDSDDLFTRIVASGVNPILELAREIAIKNAFALLGIKVEDVNSMTTIYSDTITNNTPLTAKILNEKYRKNPRTGNYEYWVAIESSKRPKPRGH